MIVSQPLSFSAFDRFNNALAIIEFACIPFAENPEHPSLRFNKLQGSEKIWPVRISGQYRAVGVRSGDTIEWIWVGTHNEFDNPFCWFMELRHLRYFVAATEEENVSRATLKSRFYRDIDISASAYHSINI